jgi:hypothetical protein
MAVSGGRLGAAELAATTNTTLYKPASGLLATVPVTFCNRSASTRTIRLAQVQSASTNPAPADGEYKLYDRTLQAAGNADGSDVLQFTGIVLLGSNNDQVVGYASGSDVDVTVDGVTETV